MVDGIDEAGADVMASPSRSAAGMTQSGATLGPIVGRRVGRRQRGAVWLGVTIGVAVGMLTALLGAVILGRYLKMSTSQQVVQIFVSEIGALSASVILLWVTRHLRRALPSGSFKARTPEETAETWARLADYPRRVAIHAAPVDALVTAAIGLFAVVNVKAPAWSLIPVVAGGEIAIVSGLAAFLFLLELALRPMLKSLARELPLDFVPPQQTRSLQLKTLAPLPLFPIGAALCAGAFPATSHSGPARLAIIFAFSVPVVLLITGFFLLVVRSLIDPITELTAATRRAGEGDLETPVPITSLDELGRLGSSFNRMLEGLREREALRDEVLRRENELRASRARIVAASDAERRRIERNIHDGAQQQLVSLAVKLRMLEDRVADDPTLVQLVVEIGDRLKGALQDLRELARGLHPSVLTTDGLLPAVEQLAARAPIPVKVSGPDERFPESIESTAYFVICEALANVAKYAQATTSEVSLRRSNHHLTVRITDDGIGGADIDAGSGLRGLTDRVAAIDGAITIDSKPHGGTTVTAEFPLP